MRIDNGPQSAQPHIRDQANASSRNGVSADAGIRDRLLTSFDPKSAANLVQQVGSTTEIRESVVNDIKTKVQNGEYLQRQSAVDTASAILNL